jgi:hypothetical protein
MDILEPEVEIESIFFVVPWTIRVKHLELVSQGGAS